jgi:glutamate-1-semialdehyde 2,1-aminomutase
MPKAGYLEGLCSLARQHGALVIYDEVITAFRFQYGAAQTYAGLPLLGDAKDAAVWAAVEPDLTALGKIIGGGLPIGAYGGRKDIMEQVAPLGPAYQAGTMAGNPASISAGIACLQALKQPGVYAKLDAMAAHLTAGIRAAADRYAIDLTINRIGGAFSTHFCNHPITNYEEAQETDGELFAQFFRLMLDQGINLAPSKYEAWFLTIAHSELDLVETLTAVENTFAEMSKTLTS